MEVRFGIVQSMKEIDIDLPEDASIEDVKAKVEKAIADKTVLWLTSKKGNPVGVPGERISYVEFDTVAERVVGFGV